MKCRGERGDRLAECGREASLQAAGAERCAACGGARQDAGGRTSKAEPHWRGDGRTRCDTESTLLNVRDDSALCADAMNHVLIKTLYEIEATSRRSDVRVIHADVMQLPQPVPFEMPNRVQFGAAKRVLHLPIRCAHRARDIAASDARPQ